MSERKEKKIRRLQRRIEELEGENDMLRTLLHEDGKSHWLRKPYTPTDVNTTMVHFKPDIAASLDYCNNPIDAHYAPIPSGHKPGFFQRLKSWLFG